MLNNLSAKMSPKAIRVIKISAIVVGAVTVAVAVGFAAYKLGLIDMSQDVLEEVIDTAANAA